MSCIWKGKKFEPYTVPLLAQLIQESGSLDGKTWHDCYSSGVCHGLPLNGYSICSRGGPNGKKYCSWKGGQSPQDRFTEDYPELATDWRSQFYHYSDQIRGFVEDGKSASWIIQSWNPNEIGRIKKVYRWADFVMLSTQ